MSCRLEQVGGHGNTLLNNVDDWLRMGHAALTMGIPFQNVYKWCAKKSWQSFIYDYLLPKRILLCEAIDLTQIVDNIRIVDVEYIHMACICRLQSLVRNDK